MDNNALDQKIVGYGISASVAVIFNTLLTIAKETNEDLLAAMKSATSHHWITQGLAVVLVFVILGFILSKSKISLSASGLTKLIVWSVVLSTLGLVIWFYFV